MLISADSGTVKKMGGKVYDVVVCVGPYHQQVAAMAIRSLYLFSDPEKIYVITASGNFEYFLKLKEKIPSLLTVNEDELIEDIDLLTLKEYFSRRGADSARAGWYFQQFLKMAICYRDDIAENYLIWDSDTIMLQPLSFFDAEGRPLINPTARFHRPYFDSMSRLLGFTRQVDFSFISEHLMIRKQYMRELISEIRQTGDSGYWAYEILGSVADNDLSEAGFSEFETYGNFVHRKHSGSYGVRRLRSLRSGAKRAGTVPRPRDLQGFSRKYEYVSFEVWTRPSKLKRILWSVESACYYAGVLIAGLFSKRAAIKHRLFSEISNKKKGSSQ